MRMTVSHLRHAQRQYEMLTLDQGIAVRTMGETLLEVVGRSLTL